MNKTVISEGIIRLIGNGGVKDKRTGRKYSQFVGKAELEKCFEDAIPVEEVVEEAPKTTRKRKAKTAE